MHPAPSGAPSRARLRRNCYRRLRARGMSSRDSQGALLQQAAAVCAGAEHPAAPDAARHRHARYAFRAQCPCLERARAAPTHRARAVPRRAAAVLGAGQLARETRAEYLIRYHLARRDGDSWASDRPSSSGANGEVAERSKALDWNSSNIFTGVRGFESHPLRQNRSMVVRIGYSATTSREPRQARKGAAAAMMSGAGARLMRIASYLRVP